MNERPPLSGTAVREMLTYDGRTVILSWWPAPYWPPPERITQASGVCYTERGQVVLVVGQRGQRALPGGHLEPWEAPWEALIREVREEACAAVLQHAYLGAQRVDDPAAPDGLAEYYQLRYWARVRLEPFAARHETIARLLAPPNQVLAALGWRATQVATRYLAAAHSLATFPCPASRDED